MPAELGCVELGHFTDVEQVVVGRLLEGIQPEGPFPGEDGGAGFAPLPFGVAEVLEDAGGGMCIGQFLECLGGLHVIPGAVGGGSKGEEILGPGREECQPEAGDEWEDAVHARSFSSSSPRTAS